MATTRPPYYEAVASSVSFWKELLRESHPLLETLREGVRDMLVERVVGLPEMGVIPQDARSIEFGEADLAKGLLPENSLYRGTRAGWQRRIWREYAPLVGWYLQHLRCGRRRMGWKRGGLSYV